MPHRYITIQCTCGNSFTAIRGILLRMPGGTVTCDHLRKDMELCKRTVPVVDIINATKDESVNIYEMPPEDTQEKMI